MRLLLALGLPALAAGQMHFDIPVEMLQGMMGGDPGDMEQQQFKVPWPKGVSGDTEERYEWLDNTEWQGKTSRVVLAAGGALEASQGLAKCQKEGSCFWAANGGKVFFLVRRSLITFTLSGSEAFSADNTTEAAVAAQSRLVAHFEEELKKVSLVSTDGKRGSTLQFKGVKENEQESSLIAKDLYAVLGVTEAAEPQAIKSAYRKLSVKLHPDKRDDGDATLFNEVRDAHEVLSDKDKRAWYDVGGLLLVKNMETGRREIESQEALAMAQLDQQIPRNHPMRKQAERQIMSQVPSKAEAQRKLLEQMTNDDEVVEVPVSLSEVYQGARSKEFVYERLVICRGCRHDPTQESCLDCGRCPPERRQVPRPGPFPGTIIGMKEVTIESKERCRKVPVTIRGLQVPRGVKEGAVLRKTPRLGHQTPGRLPGAVAFTAVHKQDDRYTVVGNDLYTVLELTLEEAVYGTAKRWPLFPGSGKAVEVSVGPGEVWDGDVLKPGDGLGLPDRGSRVRFGDLYVRIAVAAPQVGSGELTLKRGETPSRLELRREDPVRVEDGRVWRLWEPVARAGRKRPSDRSDEL